MLNRRPAIVEKSKRSSRERMALQKRNRQLIFQQLEERRVLDGYFSTIASKLDSELGDVQSALKTIQGVTELPFINKKITEINELTESLTEVRSNLANKLNSDALNNSSNAADIKKAIYDTLGPSNGGINVLTNRDGNVAITEDDIGVDMTDGVEIDINIGFSTAGFSQDFSGKGIDSIPFKPQSNTNGGFSVKVEFVGLNFGFSAASNSAFFQKSNGALALTLAGGLPSDKFFVGLGFLNLSAQDIHAGDDFSLTLKSIVSSAGISPPTISGVIHLHTQLFAEIDSEGMPQVQTKFILDWVIPEISPNTTLGASWGAPTLEFKDIQVSLGSLVGDLAKPIARHIKSIIEPLKPLFDLLEEPIPVLDDLSDEFGGPDVTLVSMVGAFPEGLPPELVRMVRSAQTLREYTQKINTLAGLSAGWLKLGDFTIAAPSGNFLTGRAPSALGSFALDAANKLLPWSDLISPSGTPNLRRIEDQIRDLLGPTVGNEVVDIFRGLTKQDEEDGLSIKFPIIENPAGVALGMLLGQDKDLVVADGRLNFRFDKPSKIKIIPGFSIILGVTGSFTAEATVGYDTRGLREAMKPLYEGRGFDFAKTVNGLWIGSNTRVDASGSLIAGPELGNDKIATLSLTGSLTLDVHATISNPHNPPLDKIRPFNGDLGDRLFNASAALTASVQMDLKIGGDLPVVGFVGFHFEFPIASETFYPFDTQSISIGIPENLVRPVDSRARLFEYFPADRLLTLNAGPNGRVRNVGTDVIDEIFTVEHIGRFDIPALYILGNLVRPAFQTDIFVIRFGSVVEVFQGGYVDAVTADMGTGNDNLKIIDSASPIFYGLYGGSEDDVIDVDGNVDAQILGDGGNDRLDAGNGNPATNVPTTVHGGLGEDEIKFGEGLLSNLAPGEQYMVIREPNDTSFDRLVIDNKKSRLDTRYFFDLDPGFGFDYRLEVYEGDEGILRTIYMSQYDAVTIFSGSGDDDFNKFAPNRSILSGGGGDDFFSLHSPTGLPTGIVLNNIGGPGISINGGDGNDTIVLDGVNRHTPPMRYELAASQSNSTTTKVGWTLFSGGEFINGVYVTYGFGVGLTSVEDTHLEADSSSVVFVRGWNHHVLHLEGAGAVALSGNDSMAWDTNIVIRHTPTIDFFTGDRAHQLVSQARIDANGPYIDLRAGYRMKPDLDDVAKNFNFNVDNAFLALTPELIARNWNIQFFGNVFSNVIIDVPNYSSPSGLAPDYTYRQESDRLVIGTMSLGLIDVGSLEINSGQGNDRFDALGYPARTQQMHTTFNGGFGEDTLFVDDSFNRQKSSWVIRPESLFNVGEFAGGFLIGYSTVENTVVRGGFYGNNVFSLWGDFKHTLRVEGGVENDEFRIGQESFLASFDSPLQVYGGPGNDSFLWYGTNNANDVSAAGTIVHNVILDGGTGSNSLTIDDTRRFTSPTDYAIYPTRIRARQQGFGAWADFNYENMRTVTVESGNNRNTFDVHGISSSTSDAFWIVGNDSADEIRVFPENVDGSLALNGSLVVDGGLGTDRVLVDASASSNDHQITIETVLIATVSGFGPKVIGTDSDVEQIELRTGSGVDSVSLENFTYSAMALDISTGSGNDELKIVPNSQSIDDSLSSASTYRFDGGDGTDTFSLFNDKSNLPWFYTRTSNALSVLSPGEYRIDPTTQSFESWTLTGGSKRDTFYLADQLSGGMTSIEGGAGLDSLFLGFNGYTRDIHGQVVFDGGVDGGMLSVLDPTNATGVTVHIEGGNDGTIGGAPGDTLFGRGGSVRYRNLADDQFGDGYGLTLRLGNGADTIYTVPLPTATTTIDAGEPSEGSGDVLYLGLNQAQNPVVQNLGAGNGRATSSNLKPVEWYSVEQIDTEYVAPTSFLVTNTLDSGAGSLRQAILDANAIANGDAPDNIRFAIPGMSAHTIRPLSPLPFITDPVVLDATTQAGYAGKPVIELDGTLAGRSNGLVILSGGSTVAGFAINRFSELANIEFLLGGGNVVQGNYIGTNLAGNAVYSMAAPTVWGVVVYGSDNNIVGTDGDGVNDEFEGNVISGHGGAGILFESGTPEQTPDNNVIAGNRIGTSADGNSVLGNARMGVYFLSGGTGNRIGTNSDDLSDSAERNIISGNPEAGIYLTSADANVIAGNFIGTNAAGLGSLGNGDGIVVHRSNNNRIGGSQQSAGNVIANSNFSGVILSGDSGTGNSILANSFFNNARLGINLQTPNEQAAAFVTPNDTRDTDSGVNNLQNFPEIGTALATSTRTIIGGQLQSTPNTQFRVEFFSSATKDPSGYGEGQSYLGYAMATTDSTGIASFVANFGTLVPVGQFISATATDPLGNTSEFSLSREVVPSSSLSNVVALQLPTSNTVFLVASPVGTNLTASIKPNTEVPPPSGLSFPYGFLDFTVTGLVPGSSADVSISGLDLSQIRDYYKLGPTPGNNSMHWYSFMLGQGNPSDNPGGTGMEVVGGNMVLHLIDGKRGDDDLLANGTIVDIGGPVSQPALVMASISGAAYLDITGNGYSSDDSPLAEVKVYLDTNNNGVWNTGEPTRLTLADGSYLFTGLAAGTYKVRQVTPTGYVRTAPTTVDHYSVVLAANQTSNLNRFANAAKGNLSALSNVVYLVNGKTPVSDLNGSTTEGDTIQVSFTIRAGAPDQRLTLVSYTAPSSSFSSNTAYKQQIFDSDTNVFGPGTHTLTVSNPHSYYQVDFVSGHAIDKFGPSGSNIFYTAQNRLISADGGGTRAVLASPASLTGSVYRDANNNGTIDAGEQAIAGVKVTVSSGSTYRSVVTDVNGVYLFDNLSAGTYVISETQPNNYADGKETLGNKGGTVGSDKFTGIVLTAGAAGSGYNFGEQQTVGLPYTDNQTQSASWWNSSQGQSLIKVLNGGPSAKNLGNWLASNFNNLFGAAAGSWSNLAGKTNSQVAAFYKSLYSNASKTPEAEALALAFNIYVTNTGLAGTKAISFGFAVSTGGLGIATTNVGARGTALGVNHGTNITIAELLSRANALSRKGVLWDANCDRKINSAENILRSQVFSLMSRINNPLAEGEAEYQPSLEESNLAVNPSVNDSNHLDVNGDDSITSLDALLVINLLNRGLDEGSQIDSQAANSNPYFVDVNGDDRLSPLDALLIINYLNTREAGEGEASSKLSQADASGISTIASPLADRAALQTGYDLNRIGKRDRFAGRLESLDLVFGELETESLFDDTM